MNDNTIVYVVLRTGDTGNTEVFAVLSSGEEAVDLAKRVDGEVWKALKDSFTGRVYDSAEAAWADRDFGER
jgi:hypothetical protein